ncbi:MULTISPECIES: DUF6229 family protein [Bacteria]|uniref:Mersacidin/lichenicidin family type 2 lantibiotic n=1 Tax=Lysobacter enzymogenes TaxID=69 RepID=A0AAU9AWL1_LYSEN|nr:DUF6229 family protein [Lysobacter enzymogenes]MBO7941984.1 hypothetical protein [Streptomyces sp. S9]BAV99908.1 hypothetical protein LEN_4421 [Lysobacter enzymogenes]
MSDNDVVAAWRNEAGSDNPAGPLFIGGEFAEADIAGDSEAISMITSVCTGCGTIQCC